MSCFNIPVGGFMNITKRQEGSLERKWSRTTTDIPLLTFQMQNRDAYKFIYKIKKNL